MRLNKVDEIFLANLLVRWLITAPKDQNQGLLDGEPIRNSQSSRMQYALKKLLIGIEDKSYIVLSRYARRNDGNSYISKDYSWMIKPVQLNNLWYFESTISLEQKLNILSYLNKIGFSSALTNCVCDFVSNKDIDKYFPTEAESNEILKQCKKDFSEIGIEIET